MKKILLIALFGVLFLFSSNLNAQSKDDLSEEIICPCMIEYDFNSDIKESLNVGAEFHPVLKFVNAEITDEIINCNYEKVFYKLNNISAFKTVGLSNSTEKWTTKGSTVVNYYNTQNFNAAIVNYIYGDISEAQFDSDFKSFQLSDSSNSNLFSKSGGNIKLNDTMTGFLIKRNDVIRMIELAPASSVPKTLGKKKNNTIKSKK